MMGFASLTGSNAATGSAAAAAALAERRRHELIAERQADRIFQVKKNSKLRFEEWARVRVSVALAASIG